MKKILVQILAVMAVLFVTSPAAAQATRTWVSGVGDDVNPCSRTAPCKTFAGAISKTATGGEINCLDPGGYGTLTITKSITINCAGTLGSSLAAGTVGFTINAPNNAKVTLNGLDVNGASDSSSPGTIGVRVLSARNVVITNTILRNFSTAGVNVASSTKVRVTIDHVFLTNNATGIIVAPSSTLPNAIMVSNTTIAISQTAGVSLVGPLASGSIASSVIFDTPKALDIQGGAVMNSYGNNVLNGLTTDTPTPTPLQ